MTLYMPANSNFQVPRSGPQTSWGKLSDLEFPLNLSHEYEGRQFKRSGNHRLVSQKSAHYFSSDVQAHTGYDIVGPGTLIEYVALRVQVSSNHLLCSSVLAEMSKMLGFKLQHTQSSKRRW